MVDLIGVRSALSMTGSLTPNSIVIQRDRNDAAGTTVTVDFATGVAPVTQTATIGNLLGQSAFVSSSFYSKNGTVAPLFSDAAGASTSTTRTWQGVPAASTITGDFHTLTVFSGQLNRPTVQSHLSIQQARRGSDLHASRRDYDATDNHGAGNVAVRHPNDELGDSERAVQSAMAYELRARLRNGRIGFCDRDGWLLRQRTGAARDSKLR